MASVSSDKWTSSKLLALFSTLVILLIPTIGKTTTLTNHPIVEHSFFWPWLILLRFTPQEEAFATDQYNFVPIPWTLLIFIPFLYALFHSYKLFVNEDQKIKRASYITLAGLIQIILIWLTFQSQYPHIRNLGLETNRIYFIPEFLLIVVNGYFAARWYLAETQEALERSKQKRLKRETTNTYSQLEQDTRDTK